MHFIHNPHKRGLVEDDEETTRLGKASARLTCKKARITGCVEFLKKNNRATICRIKRLVKPTPPAQTGLKSCHASLPIAHLTSNLAWNDHINQDAPTRPTSSSKLRFFYIGRWCVSITEVPKIIANILITNFRARRIAVNIRKGVNPQEILGLFEHVRPSLGHAKCSKKILRSKLWRQLRNYQVMMRNPILRTESRLAGQYNARRLQTPDRPVDETVGGVLFK